MRPSNSILLRLWHLSKGPGKIFHVLDLSLGISTPKGSYMSDNAAKNEMAPVLTEDPLEEVVTDEMLRSTEGNPDSLTNAIAHFVMDENYERAVRELRGYQEYKASYPTYPERTNRLFDHVENLIDAIKSKKSLTRSGNITASKRKEIGSVVILHYKQLRGSLMRIVQVEQQLRMKDSRSTVWVIQALLVSIFLITCIGLFSEAYDSMNSTFETVLNGFANWAAKFLKL